MYKAIAVADAFMSERYYRDCFARAGGDNSLEDVLWFGEQSRADMRPVVHRIERGGPDAVEPPAELYTALADAEVLMVHLCPVNSRVIDAAPRLRIILTNRGGLENIDLAAASARGIAVLSNPAHNANSVAELTLGLMISETRNLARAHRALMAGEWRESYMSSGHIYELCDRTVGLVGYGSIGRRVARKLTVFDCNVLIYDPYIDPDDPDIAKYGCRMTSLPELLASSDIVSLHARSDELILGRSELEQMKRGAYFINTARPHLVDNACIYEMLRDGRLAGAAFDVFMREPPGFDDPYIGLDNVTLTNHRGGDTVNCYADSPAMLLREAAALISGSREPAFWQNRAATASYFGR